MKVKVPSSLKLFTYQGAPVVAHWTVLLAFPLGWAVQGSLLGALVAQAAFLVLMLAHELGHAFVASRLRLPILSLHMYAIHGACIHGAARSRGSEVAVAWGGIAAQAILFFLALLLAKGLTLSDGIPRSLSPAFDVWVPINMLIAFCNLLPIAPLDGAKAWGFIPLAISRARSHIGERLSLPKATRVVTDELHRIRNRGPKG